MNINNTAAAARMVKNSISNKRELYDKAASQAAGAWEGPAREAWEELSRRMKAELNIATGKYDDLDRGLTGLDAAILAAGAEEAGKALGYRA